MYHSSPGTAAAIAGTARTHSNRALLIVTLLVTLGITMPYSSSCKCNNNGLDIALALRTLGLCESSHCCENAASVAAGGTVGCGAHCAKRKTQHPQCRCWVEEEAQSVRSGAQAAAARVVNSSGGSGCFAHVAAQFAQRVRFDLPDTLSRHAVLVSELMQRGLVVCHPAFLENVAAALVQAAQRCGQAIG